MKSPSPDGRGQLSVPDPGEAEADLGAPGDGGLERRGGVPLPCAHRHLLRQLLRHRQADRHQDLSPGGLSEEPSPHSQNIMGVWLALHPGCPRPIRGTPTLGYRRGWMDGWMTSALSARVWLIAACPPGLRVPGKRVQYYCTCPHRRCGHPSSEEKAETQVRAPPTPVTFI